MQTFTDQIRALQEKKKIALMTHDQKVMEKIIDLFGSDLPFKADQDKYAEVVVKVNGWTAAENARRFARAIEKYQSPLDNRLQMATEVGLQPAKFMEICRASNRFLLLQIATDEDLHPISRNQWEALFEDFVE